MKWYNLRLKIKMKYNTKKATKESINSIITNLKTSYTTLILTRKDSSSKMASPRSRQPLRKKKSAFFRFVKSLRSLLCKNKKEKRSVLTLVLLL